MSAPGENRIHILTCRGEEEERAEKKRRTEGRREGGKEEGREEEEGRLAVLGYAVHVCVQSHHHICHHCNG
jgi:hypothetical protein